MFYEMRDAKRYDAGPTSSSSCLGRCWVLVAMCGLLITVSFIGMTLWLGMNSRPDVIPASAYQPPSHAAPPSPNVHRPHLHYETTSATTKSAFPTTDYDAMPTTSIKNKKGRIEIVEHEKIQAGKVEPTTLPAAISTRVVDAKLGRPHDGATGGGARIAEVKLGDGVSPMEEETAAESSGVNGVKKKSEVVYPNWSDLPEGKIATAEDEPELQEEFRPYSPYVDDLQPDAQKFNPIPAFSYLKEHPVRLTGKDIRPPGGTAETDEYPYFYPQFEDVVQTATAPDEKSSTANNPLFGFLRKRLQDVRDWLAQSGVRKNQSQWIQMVDAVNQSLYTKNATIVLSKLREMYANTSDVAADTPVASLIYPAAAGNDSAASLVSFGLLAIDLFLLHNVQQIALNEDPAAEQQMLNDPDVVALNSLFLPPDRVKQLRSANSRVLSDDRRDKRPKGFVSELMEFVNGGLRAVLNLSRAYRSSSRAAKAEGKSVGDGPAAVAVSGSSLDCIWTLYCRNLDKTAKLDGPYGFLAKMNSLGLRLMMGEFPVERALEHLIKESTHGWRRLNCDRLFPRCNGEKAKQVVIDTALGQNPSSSDDSKSS
ncbi:Hypothetical protein CINCED_3A001779 [Cinara cedri]|uniref:Transmembrane protein n=1 Tax=Cinara cedri TaxID=506608 RepID=A0A5E4NIS1_9HEMI|nr:Hypothetical protein CINCED_3A001779 [Cinara cedri]